jgi:hypothetical protein
MANWNFEIGDATPGRNNLFELLDDVETAGLTGNSIIIYNPTTGQWENAEAIGSWAISSTALYLNGATDADSSGMSSSDYPFYAGKKFADRASAPFRVTKAGVLYATGATISGSISATTGNIGGWVVGTNDIKDVAGVVGLSSLVTAGDDIRFWAGHATPASAPFRLTEAGALVATSATITGDITATSGYFTSVTLGKTGVASGTLTLQLYGTHGDTYIAAGKTDFTVADPGFILGLDDSDSDKAKLYLGDSTYYMSWDGAALTYCKGAVVEPTIKLYTSTGVIKTSDTALDGTVNSAGVMIDYQGIYIAGASQDKTNAAIRLLSTGAGYFKGDVTADSGYFNTVTLGKTGVASGTLTLQLYGTHGDTYIAAGKTDFTNTDTGFIIGLDDSDSDKVKFYMGSSTKYFNWDGASITIVGDIKTAASGERLEFLSSDNKLHFYDSSNVECVIIGDSAANSSRMYIYDVEVLDAPSGTVLCPVYLYSGGHVNTDSYEGLYTSLYISSTRHRGTGANAFTNVGIAVNIDDALGTVLAYGIQAHGSTSPLVLNPSGSASAPSHTALKGSLWVTSAGVLYINTNGSTTWAKVGAQ